MEHRMRGEMMGMKWTRKDDERRNDEGIRNEGAGKDGGRKH